MKESWIKSTRAQIFCTEELLGHPLVLFWTALSKFSPRWLDLDAVQAWNYSRGGSQQAVWLRLQQVWLSFLFDCLSPPNTISEVLGQLSIIYQSAYCRSAVSAQMQVVLHHWPGCQGSLSAATLHWVSQAASENQFNSCQCKSLSPIWKVLPSCWAALLQQDCSSLCQVSK